MIMLFTDFGLSGPYIGQMKAVLYREAPNIPVVDLFADVPVHNIGAAAYLLAAYSEEFAPGSIFLCVVDPGVGTGQRKPVMVNADGRWYVGPGNGLFEVVMRRAAVASAGEILWKPVRLSASFHGRDLFAPVAGMLARGDQVPSRDLAGEPREGADWPDDLPETLYVDHFGNVMTGLRAATVAKGAVIEVGGHQVLWARTFGEVPVGTPFWYENANGLLEIAINQGRAAEVLGIGVGQEVIVRAPGRG